MEPVKKIEQTVMFKVAEILRLEPKGTRQEIPDAFLGNISGVSSKMQTYLANISFAVTTHPNVDDFKYEGK